MGDVLVFWYTLAMFPRWLTTAFLGASVFLMLSLWGVLLVQRELIAAMGDHLTRLESSF